MTRSFWFGMLFLCASTLVLAQPQPLTRWSHSISGDSIDVATSIVQATDGTYMLAGYTGSWGAGRWDMYLAKLDSFGNVSWYRTYGGLYHDAALVIRRTVDNCYVLGGYTQTDSLGVLHPRLIKVNTTGIQQWNRTYSGTEEEYVNDLQQTSDNGFILTGASSATGPFTIYLRKTDAQGNPVWTRYINHNNDEGYAVQQTRDFGFIIAGKTHYNAGDGYLVKTDATGHVQWSVFIGGGGDEVFRAVKQTPDGGYIIAGKSSTEMAHDRPYLVKTDSTGHVRWWHTYGEAIATGAFYSVDILTDSTGVNYVAAGYQDNDIFIARLDSAGNVRWDEFYSNSTHDVVANDMQVTRDASYVMVGYTVSTSRGWDMYMVKTGRDRMTSAAEPAHDGIPSAYTLSAWPNPFNAAATVQFTLPHAARAQVVVYDLSGRQVTTLLDRTLGPGEHRVGFDGSDLPSGIYFARLTTSDFAKSEKLLLLK